MLTPIDTPMAGWLLLAGRILIALVFLVSGVHKAIWYRKAAEEFTADDIPLASISLPGTIVLHISGATCLILGLYTQLAAIGLAVFTLLATYKVHGFWRFEGIDRLINSRIFLANLAVVGGLMYIAALGPGHYALS
jgi:putative oxidoreductase